MPATSTGALGQVSPGAGIQTNCYTVPVARRATVRVIVTNRGSADVFRVSVAPNGVADALGQYIAYDKDIATRDSVASVPVTLGSLDVVRVRSAGGNLTFTVTGFEQDE